MAFINSFVTGDSVTITVYTINPAKVYIASKEDQGKGTSPFNPEYPYAVVDYSVLGGEVKDVLSLPSGNYVAILYGSEDTQPYHILDYTYFVLGTPVLKITNVTATLVSAGNILISWTQNIAGLISITRNGVQVFTFQETSGGDKEWVSMNNVSGTYTFCVNGVCAEPFVLDCVSNVWYCEEPLNGYEINGCGDRRLNPACDPGVVCDSLNKDTWKPLSQKVASGKELAFTLRSTSPNQAFILKAMHPTAAKEFTSGTTDSTGCFSGVIPAQLDGDYNIGMCYPVGPICVGSNPFLITWGEKEEETDWGNLLFWIVVLIGIFYLSGVYIKSR